MAAHVPKSASGHRLANAFQQSEWIISCRHAFNLWASQACAWCVRDRRISARKVPFTLLRFRPCRSGRRPSTCRCSPSLPARSDCRTSMKATKLRSISSVDALVSGKPTTSNTTNYPTGADTSSSPLACRTCPTIRTTGTPMRGHHRPHRRKRAGKRHPASGACTERREAPPRHAPVNNHHMRARSRRQTEGTAIVCRDVLKLEPAS